MLICKGESMVIDFRPYGRDRTVTFSFRFTQGKSIPENQHSVSTGQTSEQGAGAVNSLKFRTATAVCYCRLIHSLGIVRRMSGFHRYQLISFPRIPAGDRRDLSIRPVRDACSRKPEHACSCL